MPLIRRALLIGSAAAASAGGVAWAQMPIISPNLMNGFIGANAMQAAANQGRRNRGLPTYTGSNSGSRPMSHVGAAPAASRAASTRYTRDPAVTRKVVDAFVARIERAAGPQKAELARTELSRNDFVQTWSRTAGPDGFRPGDAADALAAYWTLNWAMANGRDASSGQAAGVRAQLASLATRNPAFGTLGEAGRQELAETYMLDFVLQQSAYVQARQGKDAAALAQLSNGAEQRFTTQMHLDLRSLALTDHGFAARR